MCLKNLVKLNWGLSSERCWWIYDSVIRPRLSYSVNCWQNALKVKKNIYNLEKLQKLALTLISKPMRGTSNKGLEGVLCTEPLHLFLEGIALKSRIRTREEVPLKWDGDSHYHYRRCANERAKKKDWTS